MVCSGPSPISGELISVDMPHEGGGLGQRQDARNRQPRSGGAPVALLVGSPMLGEQRGAFQRNAEDGAPQPRLTLSESFSTRRFFFISA